MRTIPIVVSVVAIFLLVSLALAGQQGNIEPKDAAAKPIKDVEKSIGKLPMDAEVRVIVTLKDKATDKNIDALKAEVGSFKVETGGAEKWSNVYPKGFAATMTRKQMIDLQKDPSVARVDIDQKVEALLETANYWTGATKARKASPTGYGVTGDMDELPYSYSKTDVVIAIVDTGIDPKHKDLNGTDNTGTKKIIGWYSAVPTWAGGPCDNTAPSGPCDYHGHGTHVSSIAAGEGDDNPSYKGIAPGSALVGIKVLSDYGWGYWSWVIDGVDWGVDNKDVYGIKIMSLSLGGWGSSDGTDPCSVALDAAVDAGIVVTVAAGNSGPQKYTISSPGAAKKVITVGAMGDPGYLLKVLPGAAKDELAPPISPEKQEVTPGGQVYPADNGWHLAYWSSRGPTADNRIKPDVVAPGVMITAADNTYPNTAGYHGGYVTYSGTSMATPLVAGVAALMLDSNAGLTPAQVKTYIRDSAEQWGYGPTRPSTGPPYTACTSSNSNVDYGCGRVRADRAVGLADGYDITWQWNPTHKRISKSINDTTWYVNYPLTITSDDYPYASTLIMYDWSGYYPGIDLDLAIYQPDWYGKYIGGSWGYDRQETVVIEPDTLGKYNATVWKWIGAGRYSLDMSYK